MKQSVAPGYYTSHMYQTYWSRTGSYQDKKDHVFKETHDFIRIAREQRKRIEHAIKKGARILPCLR